MTRRQGVIRREGDPLSPPNQVEKAGEVNEPTATFDKIVREVWERHKNQPNVDFSRNSTNGMVEQEVINTNKYALDRFLKELGIYSKANRSRIISIVSKMVSEEKIIKTTLSGKPLYKFREELVGKPDLQGSNILEWLRAIWSDEINAGLTLQGLRDQDYEAAQMYSVWKNRGKIPQELQLLTKQQLNDRALRAAGLYPDESMSTGGRSRQINRLGVARRRRAFKAPS